MNNFNYIRSFSLPIVLLAIMISGSFLQVNAQTKLYGDTATEKKIDSLLTLMTLEEKIGQVTQLSGNYDPTSRQNTANEVQKQAIRSGETGSFLNVLGTDVIRQLQEIAVNESRLKIPLIFGLDVIHGYKTTFPVPIAEACTWDPSLVEMSSHIQAMEATAAGINWTFAPMVDIARDPRWGRIVEGNGEDTYMGTIMTAARVKGFQGNDLKSATSLLACAKHFAAYGAAEGGRDYNNVDMSERTLREIYLPPFKSAVEAGAGTLMCSFNEIAGVPSSANRFLLTDILRKEWKFEGFVVSDWNSIAELVNHGIAPTQKDAAGLALNAGLDMDMASSSYQKYLIELIKEKKIKQAVLDESVRRVLRIKYQTGLFENPFKNCNPDLEKSVILSDKNKEAALEVAHKSIVLLKNENNLLPLQKNIQNIAVIGPLADNQQDPLGGWAQLGDPKDVITLLAGIKEVAKSSTILYARGCGINDSSKSGFAEAVAAAKKSDVVVLALGESRDMSGEARSRSSIDLPGIQEDLLREIFRTGKPVILILMNGRPLAINFAAENIQAILETWFAGITAGKAIADVLFGDFNPGGKLVVSFPRKTGQIPIYYNHKNTGRPFNADDQYTSKYIDLAPTPLYPFGYGLSYTKFQYSDFSINKSQMKFDDTLLVSVNVKNNGGKDGDEVVQLYIRDEFGSVTRPVRELKGFRRINLKTGETKKVEFKLCANDLAFYDINMKFTAEAGKFKVFVGGNSVDLLENKFELLQK